MWFESKYLVSVLIRMLKPLRSFKVKHVGEQVVSTIRLPTGKVIRHLIPYHLGCLG